MSKSPKRSSATSADQGALIFVMLLVTAAAIFLMRPTSCHSQDLPELPTLQPCQNPRPTPVTHGGAPGFWFERETARCLLKRVAALPPYVGRVQLLDGRLRLRDEHIVLQERRYEVAVESEERAVGALEAAVRGRRQAEEDLGVWHRSRVLWFILGAMVILGVVVATAYAFDAITSDPSP